MSASNLSLQASGIYVKEEAERLSEVTRGCGWPLGNCSRHKRVIHIGACTRPTQVPTKLPALRKGGAHKVSSLTKRLFTIDACWEKEESLFQWSFNKVQEGLQTQEKLVNTKQVCGGGGLGDTFGFGLISFNLVGLSF